MGKPLPSPTVEYAYVTRVQITPNQLVGEDTYAHAVRIMYELKDTDKAFLNHAERVHSVAGTGPGQDSVETYIAAVAAALPDFVAADKLELSGYSPT